MLVAVCTLQSAISVEHTLVPLYCEPGVAEAEESSARGGERGLGGRQNKLCPVLVPASAMGGVAGGTPDTCVTGELVAL